MPTKRIDDETVVSYSPDLARVEVSGLTIWMAVEHGYTMRDMQHVAMGLYVALNQLKGVMLPDEWAELARRYAEYMDREFPEELPENVVRLFPQRDKHT